MAHQNLALEKTGNVLLNCLEGPRLGSLEVSRSDASCRGPVLSDGHGRCHIFIKDYRASVVDDSDAREHRGGTPWAHPNVGARQSEELASRIRRI